MMSWLSLFCLVIAITAVLCMVLIILSKRRMKDMRAFGLAVLLLSASAYAKEIDQEAMDPQTFELVRQFNAHSPLPSPQAIDIAVIRKEESQHFLSPLFEKGLLYDQTISGPNGNIPIRIYAPKEEGFFPVFVFLHGGGWVFGRLNNEYEVLCRDICSQAHVVVVAVDYRLAPEYKFPAPLLDCYAATEWVVHHAREFKGDASRLIVGGDSAGGNLAAAVTLMAQDKGFPSIQAQILIYPVLQYRFDTLSYEKYGEEYFLTKELMKWFWDQYLRKEEDGKNPYAAPDEAVHFAGLPKTLLILAQFDPLYDEGLQYGKKLENAHVPILIKTYPSIHGFMTFSNLEIHKKGIQDVVSYLTNN